VRNNLADACRYVTQHDRPVLHCPASSPREDGFVQQAVANLAAHSLSINALVTAYARALHRPANAIHNDAPNAKDPVL
jgi:hypothetical protein